MQIGKWNTGWVIPVPDLTQAECGAPLFFIVSFGLDIFLGAPSLCPARSGSVNGYVVHILQTNQPTNFNVILTCGFGGRALRSI